MSESPGSPQLDDETFGEVSESLRRDLLLHCYRFTGSVHEAEDLVQETLARAWRGRSGYRAEAGPRTWLRRIATRVCLDALRHRRGRRRLPSSPQPARNDEVLWLEPIHDDLIADADADPAAAYDTRESVSLAFLSALQRLPPRQRAVLILRDVLALSAAEVAIHLETTVGSVNSLLHRARRAMRGAYRSNPRPPDATTAKQLRSYVRAWESGDVNALLGLLKRDAFLEMPPMPAAAVGLAAIRAFLAGSVLDGDRDRWRCVTTEANGGPAVGIYQRDGERYRFTGLHLVSMGRDGINGITAYMDGALAPRFHLPTLLPGPA